MLFVSSKRRRLEARNFAVIFIFIPFTIYEKTTALQNKQVGVLRMAFRARKVFGTFEKRAPGPQNDGKCRVRMGMHSLARHFFVNLLSWVFQPSCCVSSLITSRLDRNKSHMADCLSFVTSSKKDQRNTMATCNRAFKSWNEEQDESNKHRHLEGYEFRRPK